ncbi:MAG: DegT/DnrJ/EryC1/StrS family aminotransferase, partial [Alphaproteobacteria bacterium]
ALGLGPGDAVFLPAFTFAATAEAVAALGATPVFTDVDPLTFNIDAASLDAAIAAIQKAGTHRAKGIVTVDLFGQPADYPAIEAIAAAAGLWVVADAAQAFGASLDGRPCGSFGIAATTSFFPSKPLACYGDGGAIFTDDEDLAEILRSLRIHGQGRHKYENVRIGDNSRLDTLQAAILLQKLTLFDDELTRRQAIADRYRQHLPGQVKTPVMMPGATSAWAQYTIQVAHRDRLQSALAEQAIASAVYYAAPLTRQPAYHDFPSTPGGTPVADTLSNTVLSLPMHPYLSPSDQDRVIAVIDDCLSS